MDEIPRSKLKDGNDLITKNTLLVKVIGLILIDFTQTIINWSRWHS